MTSLCRNAPAAPRPDRRPAPDVAAWRAKPT